MSDGELTPWEADASPGPPEAPDDAVVAPDAGLDLAGAALGALSAGEDAAVRVAAEQDPAVAVRLAELRLVAAELARVAPMQQINRGRSAGIRSRLIARAAASRDGRRAGQEPTAPRPLGVARAERGATASEGGRSNTAPPPSPPRAVRRNVSWLALAAGLAFVLTGAGLVRVVRDRDHILATVAAQRASLAKQMATLQASVAAKDSLIASLTGPDMRVVDLANYASQDPLARMFWNQKTQEWTMYAYNLRQPKPGKVFQVWLITSVRSQPVSAGTFTPDAQGGAVLRARYPLGAHQLERIAVSEESAGGASYPTGPIIIAGAGR